MNLVSPLTAPLNPHVFLGRHELINDQVFESDLTSQLTDAVHQILPLTMNHLSNIVQVRFCLLVLSGHLVDLLLLDVEFILLARKVLVKVDFDIFFGC